MYRNSKQIMKTQTLYQNAILFATNKHLLINQKVPGTDLPYVVHLSNVAMEILIASAYTENFNLGLAVQVALLHDTLEDTSTSIEEITEIFGNEVAYGVLGLTKNEGLSKENQMLDSLQRIKKLPNEVWAVKLADRITNLQPPPSYWDMHKRIKYKEEDQIIFNELHEGNEFLSNRLERCIKEYERYINDYFIPS